MDPKLLRSAYEETKLNVEDIELYKDGLSVPEELRAWVVNNTLFPHWDLGVRGGVKSISFSNEEMIEMSCLFNAPPPVVLEGFLSSWVRSCDRRSAAFVPFPTASEKAAVVDAAAAAPMDCVTTTPTLPGATEPASKTEGAGHLIALDTSLGHDPHPKTDRPRTQPNHGVNPIQDAQKENKTLHTDSGKGMKDGGGDAH
jgi:hypothetical protein